MIEGKIRRAARMRGLTGEKFDNYVSDTYAAIGKLQPKGSSDEGLRKREKGQGRKARGKREDG